MGGVGSDAGQTQLGGPAVAQSRGELAGQEKGDEPAAVLGQAADDGPQQLQVVPTGVVLARLVQVQPRLGPEDGHPHHVHHLLSTSEQGHHLGVVAAQPVDLAAERPVDTDGGEVTGATRGGEGAVGLGDGVVEPARLQVPRSGEPMPVPDGQGPAEALGETGELRELGVDDVQCAQFEGRVHPPEPAPQLGVVPAVTPGELDHPTGDVETLGEPARAADGVLPRSQRVGECVHGTAVLSESERLRAVGVQLLPADRLRGDQRPLGQ
ncbi:MAG: hypothetical protein L0H64_14585 [Pseudonocardia sp.]|nr:hypothetical protein [Pseudonocardia sp.]